MVDLYRVAHIRMPPDGVTWIHLRNADHTISKTKTGRGREIQQLAVFLKVPENHGLSALNVHLLACMIFASCVGARKNGRSNKYATVHLTFGYSIELPSSKVADINAVQPWKLLKTPA